MNISLQGVNFNRGSDVLTQDSQPILNEAAETLKRHPELKIEVAGHTDSTGNQEVNTTLSKARADAVMQYLIDQGVQSSLTAVGYGSSEPVADNETAEGRAQNRRVELKILE